MNKQKQHEEVKKLSKAAKLGKKASDIFGAPSSQVTEKPEPIPNTPAVDKQAQANSPRGRPQEHAQTRTKVTVILFDRQISWLDQLALTIRAKTKVAISRAEIIRAMVSGIEESSLDLSEITSETEAKQVILKHIKI